MKTLILVAVLSGAAGVSAAPRDVSSGMATGKASVSDLHFSTRAEAAAACDKAPVTTAADGSFACPSARHAINTKGTGATNGKLDNNKHPDLMK